MKHSSIFSFCNQKGGVGKTTSAINLATALSQSGCQVLLIDMDPQANATSGLGEEKSSLLPSIYQVLTDSKSLDSAIRKTNLPNLSLVPSNGDLSGCEVELISFPEREFCLRKSIEAIQPNYDFIFIDCPPSLGLLTVNALTASDYIFIPLQCEYYALEGLGQLIQTFSLVKKNLNPGLELGGVLLTMADFRTKLTDQVIKEVRDYFQGKVFETVIPRSVRLSEAPSFGKPGIIYDRSARGAKCYIDAAAEFLKKFPRRERVIAAETAEPEEKVQEAITTETETQE